MIIFTTVLYFLVSSCIARPDFINEQKNVVTAPTNCPDGQQWVNGACRDIWRVTAAPANLVTVPTNCPPGQEYVNGQCRDVWIKQNNIGSIQSYNEVVPQNLVTAPPNCPLGQQWVNGACREVWRGLDNKNVITVPTNCPEGEQFINGQCREVWRRSPQSDSIENYLKNIITSKERNIDDSIRNVISVPNQCPAGYRPDAFGNCREIFK